MNNMIIPNGFQLYLKYICDCGTDHWLRQEEVRKQYILYCDVCNKRHVIKPVESIKINLKFSKIQSPAIANVVPKLASFVQEAVNVLSGYGYTKEEILASQNEIKATNTQELVKAFLAKQI